MKILLQSILIILLTGCSIGKTMSQVDYLEKGKYIWQNFVPESGQAEFVQGELLRAVEKLRDEAQRNGNGNFNKKCHGTLVKYLRIKLCDKEVFDRKKIRQINEDLDTLKLATQPYLEDDIYDRVSERAIDWYLYYGGGIRHERIRELNC